MGFLHNVLSSFSSCGEIQVRGQEVSERLDDRLTCRGCEPVLTSYIAYQFFHKSILIDDDLSDTENLNLAVILEYDPPPHDDEFVFSKRDPP